MPTILLVEDDAVLAETMRYNLERAGYRTLWVDSGGAGLTMARQQQPELIILDIMLPDLDGFAICRMLRRDSQVPIIMLSARSNEYDRMSGLDLGADDYIAKPFNLAALLDRIQVLLERGQQRRQPPAQRAKLQIGELRLNVAERRLFRGDQELHLSPTEFELLLCLLRQRGTTLSRDLLWARVWGPDAIGNKRLVDLAIGRLRTQIERNPIRPVYIQTVRGLGYRFTTCGEQEPVSTAQDPETQEPV